MELTKEQKENLVERAMACLAKMGELDNAHPCEAESIRLRFNISYPLCKLVAAGHVDPNEDSESRIVELEERLGLRKPEKAYLVILPGIGKVHAHRYSTSTVQHMFPRTGTDKMESLHSWIKMCEEEGEVGEVWEFPSGQGVVILISQKF